MDDGSEKCTSVFHGLLLILSTFQRPRPAHVYDRTNDGVTVMRCAHHQHHNGIGDEFIPPPLGLKMGNKTQYTKCNTTSFALLGAMQCMELCV